MAEKKISVVVQALVDDARRKLKGLTGEIESMSSQMEKAQRTTAALPRSLQDVDKRAQDLLGRTERLKGELADFSAEVDQSTGSLSALDMAASAATDAVVLLGAGFAAVKLGEKAIEIAESAAAARQLADSFEYLSARSQVDSERLLDALKEASRGTISEYDLMRQASEAWSLGIADDIGSYTDLMKIAEVKSKEFGMTTVAYWDRLHDAIRSGYPDAMRNLGLVIDMEIAYDRYAATVGRAAEDLTEAERIQARLNAVLLEGEPALARWAQTGQDASQVFQEFHAVTADLRQELAERLIPVLLPALKWINEGLRANEDPLRRQNEVIADLVKTTGSLAQAEIEFAKNIEIGSQGLIDRAEAARVAHVAMVDYKIALVGIDAGIQEDIKAMRMAEKATIDWSDATAEGTRDLDDLNKEVERAARLWQDYQRDVANENWRFNRRMADLQFRATQAAENAAFQRSEIERRFHERRADIFERAQHEYEMALLRHQQRIRYLREDHLDALADLEYDYDQQRSDLMRRAPWWIRQALAAEYRERDRIAKTGDADALRDFDASLLERIRAIDPVYAEELERLKEQYEHRREIEGREQGQALDRAQDAWDLQRREQEWAFDKQLRDLERDLQNQLRAWEFHNQQRLEEEARAMDNLIAEHGRKLQQLEDNLNIRLGELNLVWEHWGWTHGQSYVQALGAALTSYTPAPPGAALPGLPSIWNWLGMGGGGGGAAAPSPAGAGEGAGVMLNIENLSVGPGVTPMTASTYARETAQEFGKLIRQQG